MAASTKTFTIKINGVDTAIKSVNELEDSIQSLENELNTADFGSESFQQIRTELVAARTQMEEFDMSTQAIKGGQIADGFLKVGEAAAGAFGLVTTALTAFGASSEDVEKVQAKLQTVAASLASVKMITEALSAENRRSIKVAAESAKAYIQAALARTREALAAKAAALATQGASTASIGAGKAITFLQNSLKTGPLLVIAGVVAAAAAAFALFQKNAKDAIEATNKAIEGTKEGIQKIIGEERKRLEVIDAQAKREIASAKARGDSAIQIAELEAKFAKERTDFVEKDISNAEKRIAQSSTVISSLEKELEVQKNISQANVGIAGTSEQRRVAAEKVKELTIAIASETARQLELEKQIKDFGAERLDIKTQEIGAETNLRELQESAAREARAKAEAERVALQNLRDQIDARLALSKTGLGISEIESNIAKIESELNNLNAATEEGLQQASILQGKLYDERVLLAENAANEAKKNEEKITSDLKAQLELRNLGPKQNAIELDKINQASANNQLAIDNKLNDEKIKLLDDYDNEVQKNADSIVDIRNEQLTRELDLEKVKLEGIQAANDRIVEDEQRTANERISAVEKSSQAQLDIINKDAEQQLIGLKKDSAEYLTVIEERNNRIEELEANTAEQIQEIQDQAQAKRIESAIALGEQTVSVITSAVQIAQTIISSLTQEVDARIEETKGRISDLENLQDNLLSKQNTLEDELQNARGQRAEDLLSQINSLASARSAAAAAEQAQNDILAKQEKEKAKLAQASAIASAIQTTAQAALATAIAFTPSPGDAAVPFGVGLAVRLAASIAFVASLVSSISAIKNAAKFEKGGEVGGKLHKDGGTMIEAEKGEFVINRKATQNNIGLLKQINSEGSSKTLARKYENGGVVGINSSTFNALNSNSNANVSENIKQLQSQIDAMANRPVYVSVQDINDGQKGYAKIKNSVSF